MLGPVLHVLLFAAGFAAAGHPLWEKSRFEMSSNGTAGVLRKRGHAIRPLDHIQKLWDGRTVTYCYENTEAKQVLHNDLLAAMELWYTAGLSHDFKWQEGSSAQCRATASRTNILLIRLNREGRLSTTLGVQPSGSGFDGPTMDLDPTETVGLLTRSANFAHEIGHAYGLLHEHQVPHYWPSAFVAGLYPAEQRFNFHCDRLADYEAACERAGDDCEQMCRSRTTAAKYKFNGAEFLPILNHLTDYDSFEDDPQPVDVLSIMIYPSGAGGIKPPGHEPSAGDDQRAQVLTWLNGNPITPNLSPSNRDVAMLHSLYTSYPPSQPNPVLINNPSSPKYGGWRKLLGRCFGG